MEKLSGSLVDLRGIQGRLEGVRESLLFFVSSDEKFCHWFEVKKSGKGMAVKLCSSPLEVAESIKSAVLDQFKTVVMTSATLAVGEHFDFLEKRTGISSCRGSGLPNYCLRRHSIMHTRLSSGFRRTFPSRPHPVLKLPFRSCC